MRTQTRKVPTHPACALTLSGSLKVFCRTWGPQQLVRTPTLLPTVQLMALDLWRGLSQGHAQSSLPIVGTPSPLAILRTLMCFQAESGEFPLMMRDSRLMARGCSLLSVSIDILGGVGIKIQYVRKNWRETPFYRYRN